MTDEALTRFKQTQQLRQFAKDLRALGEEVETEHYAAEEGFADYRQAVEAFNEKLEEARTYITEEQIAADLDGLAEPLLWPEFDDPEIEAHALWLGNLAHQVANSGQADE
jgi:hypothetical protein